MSCHNRLEPLRFQSKCFSFAAGFSSVTAGGSNYHVALEDPDATTDESKWVWRTYLGDLHWRTLNDAENVSETKLTLTREGNVGIGTTSPDFPLQVNGSIVPEVNGQNLGDASASLYWNLLSADITFMNGFKLTEDGDDALAIFNPDGIKILRIDKDGNLFIKGELKELQ